MSSLPTPPLSPLIIDLKREHADIVQSLAALKRVILATGDASTDGHSDGREVLATARDLLLAHLKKEDEQLYGVLAVRAQNDLALARTLELFAKDMHEISVFAIHFFTTHGDTCKGPEFARDFAKLISVLGDRIMREEVILYPAYDLAVAQIH